MKKATKSKSKAPKHGSKSKKASKPAEAETAGAEKPKAEVSGKLSCLDAAVEMLKAKGESMRCKDMITAMAEQKLWTSNAPTPHATLYSAILREITTKGNQSRFKKTDRGHFTLNA